MKSFAKFRIMITIIFLAICVAVVFVCDYIAGYYEKLGKDLPSWIYYLFFVGLGLAYIKVTEILSKKDEKK